MLLSHKTDQFEYLDNGLIDPNENISLLGQWLFDESLVLNPSEIQYSLNWLISALDGLFNHFEQLKHIKIPQKSWQKQPAWHELIQTLQAESFSRYEFYQSALVGHSEQILTLSDFKINNLTCPIRNSLPKDEVYRRFDHQLQQFISFKVIDIESDIDIFYKWMHNPRVSEFWQQDWSKEKLKQYLLNKLSTPITLPLIGYFNDQPFGYFEVYWAAEDHISAHYNWQAYDRGLHLLIGEENFRGRDFFASWLCAISQFIYQDETKTQRIVLEPRADNHKLFKHILNFGYQKLYDFEFPHKTATLLMGKKEDFFKRNIAC